MVVAITKLKWQACGKLAFEALLLFSHVMHREMMSQRGLFISTLHETQIIYIQNIWNCFLVIKYCKMLTEEFSLHDINRVQSWFLSVKRNEWLLRLLSHPLKATHSSSYPLSHGARWSITSCILL